MGIAFTPNLNTTNVLQIRKAITSNRTGINVMTTRKVPLTLEHAISEAMRPPPNGVGAVVVAGLMGVSPSMLYKATNPNNREVALISLVTVQGLLNVSASMRAAGLHDLIIPALDVAANAMSQNVGSGHLLDLAMASAKVHAAVGRMMARYAEATDPNGDGGAEVTNAEAKELILAIREAKVALEAKERAVAAAASREMIGTGPCKGCEKKG